MNFESILIITYGRSGSTLLQGVLNSHEEVLIRGENYNFCYGLFESFNALKKTKKIKRAINPENPFFGSIYYDEEYFLKMTRQMIKNLLYGDQIGNDKIRCYGFKEIRYEQNPKMFNQYLDFLTLIFPKPALIFNTRNIDAVINSRQKIQWKGNISKASLEQTEKNFFNYLDKTPANSFHITYEDLVSKSESLHQLYAFLGLPFSETKIDYVLSFKHSNKIVQKQNSDFKNRAVNLDDIPENFKIISFEDRYLEGLKKDIQRLQHIAKEPKTPHESKNSSTLNWFVSSFFNVFRK